MVVAGTRRPYARVALRAMAPLRIDPVAEARRHWEQRWGPEPSRPMAAVTSIMRAQQVLLARLNELVRPHGLTFPRYEALVLLSYTRRGELPIGKLGERLQVHRTSATGARRSPSSPTPAAPRRARRPRTSTPPSSASARWHPTSRRRSPACSVRCVSTLATSSRSI